MLEVRNLEVVYDGVMPVLRSVGLKVPAGSMVALLGANGVGKTTLLRALSGLPDVHDGEIARDSVRCSGSGPCKARGRTLSGSRSTKQRADNDRRDRRLSRRPVG